MRFELAPCLHTSSPNHLNEARNTRRSMKLFLVTSTISVAKFPYLNYLFNIP